jgi:hypothetical protein
MILPSISGFLILLSGPLVILQSDAFCQASDPTNSYRSASSFSYASNSLTFTDPTYRAEALGLLLAEANRVARELHLDEKSPLTQADFTEVYVTPPRLVQRLHALGNVTTSNYTYYVSVGDKFSFLVARDLQNQYPKFRQRYRWPMSQMDTNSAYVLATQFLAAVSMDVAALNRDCQVTVLPHIPEGRGSQHFVPLYWVYWTKRQETRGSIASVEILVPTKTILQMSVNRSEYILREPLIVKRVSPSMSDVKSVNSTATDK